MFLAFGGFCHMNTATTMDCPPPPSPSTPSTFHRFLRISYSIDLLTICVIWRLHHLTTVPIAGKTATPQLSDGKSTTPKSLAELVTEISMIEIEIVHLERFLLSLYRNAFQQHLPSVKGNHEIMCSKYLDHHHWLHLIKHLRKRNWE